MPTQFLLSLVTCHLSLMCGGAHWTDEERKVEHPICFILFWLASSVWSAPPANRRQEAGGSSQSRRDAMFIAAIVEKNSSPGGAECQHSAPPGLASLSAPMTIHITLLTELGDQLPPASCLLSPHSSCTNA